MEQCPYCNKLFKRVKTHLRFCKHKPDATEFNGICPTDDSSGKQRCPPCNDSFIRLKTHLHYCKHKPDGEEFEASCGETDSSGKQRCPHCCRLVKCLKKHLLFCVPQVLLGCNDRAEDQLTERLRDTKVDKKQPVEVIETIDNIKKAVLDTLNDDCSDLSSMRWKAINSGSYYELVKIDEANEFDLMFACKVNCDVDFKPENGRRVSGNYVALKEHPGGAAQRTHTWTSPKAFYKHFRDAVGKALEQPGLRSTSRRLNVKYKTGSPAVTLDYKTWDKKPYAIDLVPAIEFDGFPPEAERILRKSWIPKEYIENLCSKFHVVAKLHPSEQCKDPPRCHLWRLSFSAAEKAMVYRADGLFAGGHNTCRKAVLRLLKTDLLDFYTEPIRQDAPQPFSSYYLKMIMLSLYDEFPNDGQWDKDTMLLPRYVDALLYWKRSLVEGNLPFYFNEGVNLMEELDLDRGTKSQLRELRDHVLALLEEYAVLRR